MDAVMFLVVKYYNCSGTTLLGESADSTNLTGSKQEECHDHSRSI